MPCSLDMSGLVAKAKSGAKVTVKVISANATLRKAALNQTDISANIDATDQSVFFNVVPGTNTVILTLFPAPAPEPLAVVEDCGGGTTQPIIAFGSGIRTAVTFDIQAS
jgi:hypothetical protein